VCDGRMHLMDVGISGQILGNLAAWKCIDGRVSIVQETGSKYRSAE
jgi:hypothetical protein